MNINEIKTFLITPEGEINYKLKKDYSLHRDALKATYKEFEAKDIYIMPIPLFQDNAAVCDMIAASGYVVFREISSSNLEGMFNFPEVLTENQINVLENINFDEYELHNCFISGEYTHTNGLDIENYKGGKKR
jgi:hypothetical protein